jgi:hypothetical protein
MKKKFVHRITVDFLGLEVLLCCAMRHTEIEKHLKELGEDWSNWLLGIEGEDFGNSDAWGEQYSTTIYNDAGESRRLNYIFLYDGFNFNKDYNYCALAHEVLHLLQFTLPRFGIDIHKETESSAYLHTHIMSECLEALRNNTKHAKSTKLHADVS